MKARAVARTDAPGALRVRLADYLDLTKPRIALMALAVTLTGHYMATQGALDAALAIHTLLGTGLVAAGACALNHVIERRFDALMRRTEARPLPAGRMTSAEAAAFGVALSILGVVYLFVSTNPLAAALAAVTLALYLLVYTPLKRLTALNTLAGAVPGAMPPLIGWAAATGSLSRPALTLFAILFLWQLPHFYAIAWLYRDDYARGGFRMLSTEDPDGHRTARQVMVQTFLLAAVSLMPTLWGQTGIFYFCAALALGGAFWFFGWRLASRLGEIDARRLLLASIVYLPLLLAAMAIDKI